jgi:putative flippase GtrA
VGRDLAAGRLPLASVREHLPLVGDDRSAASAEGSLLLRQLVRFATVGVLSTVAYALLYLVLAGPLGPQAANVVALLLTAVANTAANRRLTFGVRGRSRALQHQGQGLAVFALAWALTAGSLAALHALAPAAPRAAELVVLVAANLAATVLRFVLLRGWVFRHDTTGSLRPDGTGPDDHPAAPGAAALLPTSSSTSTSTSISTSVSTAASTGTQPTAPSEGTLR